MNPQDWSEIFRDECNEILTRQARPDSSDLESWRAALVKAHDDLSMLLWRVDRYVIARNKGETK